MKDYEIDIKFYEGLLKDAKESLEQVNSNTEEYSKEAIAEVLNERFGGSESSGATIEETTVIIDNETCYQGQAFWNNGNRIRGFYVGTVTGTIYNGDQEKVGILETFNFGDIE